MLIALIERAGGWSTTSSSCACLAQHLVEEGNLKVQIGVLRRALGDGHSGCRYLATVPGAGTSSLRQSLADKGTAEGPLAAETKREHNLPVRLT
jgi:DNA-binding winged helix-turn-helix (wHTH) protein